MIPGKYRLLVLKVTVWAPTEMSDDTAEVLTDKLEDEIEAAIKAVPVPEGCQTVVED